jgi:hypothetical protein
MAFLQPFIYQLARHTARARVRCRTVRKWLAKARAAYLPPLVFCFLRAIGEQGEFYI